MNKPPAAIPILCLLLGCFGAMVRGAEAERRRPNVVLILIDDLGWTDLGCYGSTYYETPNIDRLAAEGMRFENAYAACAVCSPTRAAVLTGRYPARLGITDWIRARFQGGRMPADRKNPSGYVAPPNRKLQCPENALWLEREEVTLAEALAPAGYTSCHIGKWHLGMDDWYPERQGFDQNFGGCDFGQPPSYFDPYYLERTGGIPTLEPRRPGEYLTDREADEAVLFIRKHRKHPFFLYLAHYAVHTPIQAREDLVDVYREKPKTNHKDPVYAAMIHSVDDAVGRVLKTLRELKLDEETLIIFTSDNGGLLGKTDNAPLRAGKGHPYEGGVRVPLIVRWTGVVPERKVSREPVTSIDFFPTVIEAARVEPPTGVVIDGRSLLAHLASGGARALDRQAIYWHFPHYRQRNIGPYSIVRAGDFKLIKWWEGPRVELYHLGEDLAEKNDLSRQRPEKVAELEKRLDAHLDRISARRPRINPNYEPEKAKPQKKGQRTSGATGRKKASS